MKKEYTIQDLQKSIIKKQLRDLGFKSIREANKNGYNVGVTNILIKLIPDYLPISYNEAEYLANKWVNEEKCKIISHIDYKIVFYWNNLKQKYEKV